MRSKLDRLELIFSYFYFFVSVNSRVKPSPSVIVSHPGFRMFVLANRPGFPFLGNDFFGAMGEIDTFSFNGLSRQLFYPILSSRFCCFALVNSISCLTLFRLSCIHS